MRNGELEERLPLEQAKGEAESEVLGISPSQAKCEHVGTILDGEGEGEVSQGETLMQEQRDLERYAGTEDIRMEPVVDNLDASQFSHPIPSYQVMAGQSNVQAEETLGLLHTSEALERAQLHMLLFLRACSLLKVIQNMMTPLLMKMMMKKMLWLVLQKYQNGYSAKIIPLVTPRWKF